MKKLLILGLILGFAGIANAQTVTDPTTGATTDAGSSLPGCSASSILYTSATKLLTCNPATVVNGSVSTAGRSILTIRDTVAGDGTQSYLSIAATNTATRTAAMNAILFDVTGGDADAFAETGLRVNLNQGSGTPAAPSYGIYVQNARTGNFGGPNFATGIYAVGQGVGVVGTTLNTAGFSKGVLGSPDDTGTSAFGVLGASGTGSTNRFGGYFTLGSAASPLTAVASGVAALAADNLAIAANIIEARDNGTAVFTIADGGAVTATSSISAGSFNTGVSTSGVSINFYSGGVRSGSAGQYSFSATDQSAAQDLILNRDAAATLQLGVDVNGAPVAQTIKAHDGITGTDVAGANLILAGGRGTGAGAGGNLQLQTSPALGTGTTAQTLQQRDLIVGKQFALADNTIVTFAVVTLGNDTGGGGSIDYCVYANDATTAAQECGRADFSAIDVTAGAGGEVCTFTKVGTPAAALSGATLAVTFTGTTGTDLCNLRVTSDHNIATPLNHYIKYRVINNGQTVVTPQ